MSNRMMEGISRIDTTIDEMKLDVPMYSRIKNYFFIDETLRPKNSVTSLSEHPHSIPRI